jgi:hypothetical protein
MGLKRRRNNMASEKKECTTRREFVEKLAATACAGALAGLQIANAAALQTPNPGTPEKQTAGSSEKLVAICGLYCGACPAYIATKQNNEEKTKALSQQFGGGRGAFSREDLLCEGCLGGGRLASFCKKCVMRDCSATKSNIKRCSDCSEFPCSRITNFNNDGMPHHSEVLANLRQIKEMGMQKWTRHEEERWRCPQCKTSLAWYDPKCPNCGATRSDRLFPLKKA